MPPQKSDFDREMHHLEAEVRRLESEYNMFFSGRLKRPPYETKNRVAALIKKHDQAPIRNTADRFRFESLQNRFQKFLELVERQLTNRELGRPTLGVRHKEEPKKAPAAEHASPAHGKSDTTKSGVRRAARAKEESVVRFGKAGDVDTRTKELYEKLAAAKKEAGEKPIAIERIQALVKQQVDKFKSEGKDVAFRVAMKDGKVTLTAKATDDKD